MEIICYQMRLTNVKRNATIHTCFQLIQDTGVIVECHGNLIELPKDCIIGFDNKSLSHVLYVHPPRGFIFKVRTWKNLFNELVIKEISLIDYEK